MGFPNPLTISADGIPRFIIVAGVIGVGKTTFTSSLAGSLKYEPLYELGTECPYLGDFYADPTKWAYPMQEWFKSHRYRMHQYAVWSIRAGKIAGAVMDRSIWEDTIFAQVNRDLGTIDPRNFDTYLRGFSDMVHTLMEPDVLIYLDASAETCQRRALKRDRPEERTTAFGADEGIPIDYLGRLRDAYDKWLTIIAPRIPVVRIPWETFRPVEQVWGEVQQALDERTRYTRSLVLP